MSSRDPAPQGFCYVRLFCDQGGASHFEERSVSLTACDFAPPAPTLGVAELAPASSLSLVSGSAGWGGDTVAHPTPRRQFFCTLAGRFELTTSDGETRAFGPGSLLLLEDTRGEGHLTKFLDASVVVAAIALAEPSAA